MSTGQDTAIGNGTVVTDRGVQAEVLTADGVHLRYIDQGAGRPVVFVHGWLSCAEHWRPVAAPIAGMARAVTYDQRGHGASDDGNARGGSEENQDAKRRFHPR